jgi:hypothetical protein
MLGLSIHETEDPVRHILPGRKAALQPSFEIARGLADGTLIVG